MTYSASRLTAYAILSAIEQDLRATLVAYVPADMNPEAVLGSLLYSRALQRFSKEGLEDWTISLTRILEYTDFADSFQLLFSNSQFLPVSVTDELKESAHTLQVLTKIRNRVAHNRLLLFDDLANTLDSAAALCRIQSVEWTSLRETLSRLESDPSFVFGVTIPTSDVEERHIYHNLPLPDFDETGFVGRRQEVTDLKRHCLGAYPVISVVGEGGLGKTALALKVLYDLLDDTELKFDAIIWSSSKTTQLTSHEVRKIDNAITSSLGIIRQVTSELSGFASDDSDPMAELLSYLAQFRILLVLDNLENVIDDRIRALLSDLPSGSKILITSRVGLGAYEYPFKLAPLSDSEAADLLRATAKYRGIDELARSSNIDLEQFCKKMHNSPGYIKWFVATVGVGKRPEEVLANPAVFLNFCMSNIYENLTVKSKDILSSMLSLPEFHSQAELAYFNNVDVPTLQKALQQLLSTNILVMQTEREGSAFVTRYGLAEMPRAYILANHTPSPAQDGMFLKRKRILVAATERMGIQDERSLSFAFIKVRSKSDLVVARFLTEALREIKDGEFIRAEELIESARKLAPEYYEVYRVQALLQVEQDKLAAARSSYEAAIELEPKSAPLRYWYGGFLLRKQDDAEGALLQFECALTIAGRHSIIEMEAARAALYQHKYLEASRYLEVSKLVLQDNDLWNLRKWHDLSLQMHARLADDLAMAGEHESSAKELLALRSKFESMSDTFKDQILLQKLTKVERTARACYTYGESEEAREIGDQILIWLDVVVPKAGVGLLKGVAAESSEPSEPRIASTVPDAGRLQGRIDRLPGGIGHIIDDHGKKYVFFMRSLKPAAARKARKGARVSFSVSSKGPKRIKKELLAEAVDVDII